MKRKNRIPNTPLEKEVEADLIKRAWLIDVPALESQSMLWTDMRAIIQEKDYAFKRWLSNLPFNLRSQFGSVGTHAEKTLYRHFSGEPLSEATVFRHQQQYQPADWQEWNKFAGVIDWQTPVPSIWSDQGPIRGRGMRFIGYGNTLADRR